METGNNRPQGHKKKVGQGSVSVGKTEKVETGHGPVGSGQRPSAPQGGRPSGSGRAVRRAAGGGGSTLLLLVLAYLLLRGCGGSGSAPIFVDDTGTADSQIVTVTQAPAPTQAPAAATPTPTPKPTAAPSNVTAAVRPKRYTPHKGDSVTIMVYMCGTDLESNYGMATSDLQEMASANIADNVNILVETGGCRMWKNKIVSNSTNQIYKVETGGVRALETKLGKKAMVESSTLTEFINYCKTNYPADRNILIFWDHGGGSISGYGYDELYKSAGSMDLAEISAALKAADCTFDWIGFDACLMATLETALVCNDYADYLIASEESEPGTGWYYTNWLNMLSKDTAVDTVTLGKKVIDDFVSTSLQSSARSQVSLSIIDLAEMQGTVPPALNSFATSTTALIKGNQYKTVSSARAGARQFASSSRINQIDLVHFAQRLGTAEGNALANALLGCVKYNKTNISNANGVSIYFPYESTGAVKTAISTYNQVGMDADYTKCISSFASMAGSGQMASSAGSYGSAFGGDSLDIGSLLNAYLGGGSSQQSNSGSYSSFGASPLEALLGGGSGFGGSGNSGYGSSSSTGIDMNSMMQLIGALAGGRSMPADMDWFDTDTVAQNAEYLASVYIDPADITLTIRPDGKRVLSLTAEQWEIINAVELNVYVGDGQGFIDLGLDDTFEYDGNDLLLDFDGTWLTVNGHIAAYYADTKEGDEFSTGHIPARLTRTADGTTFTQLVYLEVAFDDEGNAEITGARPMFEEGSDTVAKGGITIGKGDVLEFLCDYYSLDRSFDSTWTMGEPLKIGDAGLSLEYLALENTNISVTYRLTDIYGNHFWTPAWDY